MLCTNHAFVAKCVRVQGGSDRRFRLESARHLGGLVILGVGALDAAEDCLRRVGEDVLASLCLDAWRSTDHGCHGAAPYMTTTQHLITYLLETNVK